MVRAPLRFAQLMAVALLFAFQAAPAAALQTEAADREEAVSLPPGRYVWNDVDAAAGPVTIVVSVPTQLLFAFRGSTLVGVSTVSTGQPGYDTPTGTFAILQKEVDHRSNIYDDAPMPFMQRLTWDGVALHAGKITGQPESHGCVRLPLAFAKKLYAATGLGARVTVTDVPLSSADEAAALARDGVPAGDAGVSTAE
ncbi:MAG: L,D-transpeptidase family protein [Alphaproteobacteria bacterium]|nr:L,D-transpeptidase family protein [Alphaproteobacteria bacterium]MBV9370391.1 L,D-transpeptidase family protein [Alphaproteobacteria bacterium]MBV9900342.1 L,D-transpeptidase family protein [Alphaproteobacteria bacterium]